MSIALANLDGRAQLVIGDHSTDVERGSGGRLPSDPMAVLRAWDAFLDWAHGVRAGEQAAEESRFAAPVPRPRKVFGIGVNYKSHVEEAKMQLPKQPMVFTKFPSCIVGPRADVVLSSGYVDWEAELVVVVGRGGRHIPAERALEHVAGYAAGQDISDRKMQFSDNPPQFSMGKSVDTFGPIGPAVVALEAFGNPNDLTITCDIDSWRAQEARTSDMIFAVPELIAFLSRSCTLEPGDLIFTGTPAGVGSTRDPRRYLKPGEVITTTIGGVGALVNRCVEPD